MGQCDERDNPERHGRPAPSGGPGAPEPARRTVTRRDAEGTELGPRDLDPEIFGIEPNLAVLHQVVTAQLAAARAGTQSTKTRAEVRGGGAKPYRQKGTGRARQGSTRSPQWTGGGVALGPKPRSYRQATPKRMVRLALCSALSDRAAEDRVALVDRWPWEAPKTKDARAALEALGLEGRTLVVLAADDLVARRSFANLPAVQLTTAGELSAYDVVRSDWVVFTDATLPGGGEGAADPDAGESASVAEAGPEAAPVAEATEAREADAGAPGDEVDDEPADGAEASEEEDA